MTYNDFKKKMIDIYQEERLLMILEYLKDQNKISNQEICNMLNISRDTARRDIIKLVEEGTAIRTHGGIALPHLKDEIKAYKERLHTSTKEKYLIGKAGSTYIQEDELCFLDVSTTVKCLCEALEVPSTLYTHSLDNAEVLSNKKNIKVHLIGGALNFENRFFYDPDIAIKLNNIYFDKVFLGATGFLEDGVYFANREDAYIKKIVAKRSKQVILLADYEKFNHTSRYKGFSFSSIDTLITDKEPPPIFLEKLEKSDVEIEIVKE
ncbi:DeoR/GlpR family DNA-binding transcription regulator [Bacillus sp. EB600]|uniref:DeoR/GlpR family DNA-binding transcription regulator n=1 Tax=Bacillus sp. EB600 TaxID=2806345 RepID=UPI00210E9952|nr:DeoR/GlpR family DNA-binding transcription regulator [Bacillus sp. EB600]MCQ6281712.1 DeoR/GlpR transcriptional regulator [Bacillus sp. EB600]